MNSALSSIIFPLLSTLKSFSGAQTGKLDLTPGSGRPPGEGHGNPTPVFFTEEFDGQRSILKTVLFTWQGLNFQIPEGNSLARMLSNLCFSFPGS